VANPRKQVLENVPGDFFVDSTCIDCDTCGQIAPAVFGQAATTSFVKAQPATGSDRRVPKSLGRKTLNALITRAGNEVLGDGAP
jgi:hypothetical protein